MLQLIWGGMKETMKGINSRLGLFLLGVTVILCFVGCGDTDDIVLQFPETNAIEKIEIEYYKDNQLQGSKIVQGDYGDFIYELFSGSTTTKQQSISEIPANISDYEKIIFSHSEEKSGRTEVYIYEKRSSKYMEQPYVGIRKISDDSYNMILNYDSHIGDGKRYIMIDGDLYEDSGEIFSSGRCGVMDGEIVSSVESGELPSENNQSNFGSGYSYQYGGKENSIDVLIDGKWYSFEKTDI